MSAAPAPLSGDLILRGGVALTMDDAGGVLADVAIALTNGRIAAIGDAAEITGRFVTPRALRASHHILMPGLVNINNHNPLMVVRGVVEDIGFVPVGDRRPTIFDGDEVVANAQVVARRLWERAGHRPRVEAA